MYFKAFSVKVTGGATGFDSETTRPVIAMRLVRAEEGEDAETEVLVSNDDGQLAWVERSHLQVVETGSPAPRTALRQVRRTSPGKARRKAPRKAPRKTPRKTARKVRPSGGLVDQ
jgi:hypothetical protein